MNDLIKRLLERDNKITFSKNKEWPDYYHFSINDGEWKDSEIDILIEEYEEKLESIKQDTKPEIN